MAVLYILLVEYNTVITLIQNILKDDFSKMGPIIFKSLYFIQERLCSCSVLFKMIKLIIILVCILYFINKIPFNFISS